MSDPQRPSRKERRRREEHRVLASLIKWAQEHPMAPDYLAGPTTDPATVADRILRGGRIKVRTKGVPDTPGFWVPRSADSGSQR